VTLAKLTQPLVFEPIFMERVWGGRHLESLYGKRLPSAALIGLVVTTAAALIPVRLYLAAAVAFDLRQLPSKFRRMFPVLLLLDLLWALAPFLLVRYVSIGLALGFTAILVYLPFAHRSLILMYARGHSTT